MDLSVYSLIDHTDLQNIQQHTYKEIVTHRLYKFHRFYNLLQNKEFSHNDLHYIHLNNYIDKMAPR